MMTITRLGLAPKDRIVNLSQEGQCPDILRVEDFGEDLQGPVGLKAGNPVYVVVGTQLTKQQQEKVLASSEDVELAPYEVMVAVPEEVFAAASRDLTTAKNAASLAGAI